MTLTVRPLCTDDYPQWRPLWDGYTHFYECYLDESVTAATGQGARRFIISVLPCRGEGRPRHRLRHVRPA